MAGTHRLYYADSYRKDMHSNVVSNADNGMRVVLEQTVFYPTSGGQPHDLGTLDGIPVVDVVDDGLTITHILASPLEAQTVQGEIDWARRYDHMQQHTGQHLLSAVFEELFGWQTVSFAMGAQQSTIELHTVGVESSKTDQAIFRATKLAQSNPAIKVAYEDAANVQGLRKPSGRSGRLRIIEIEGIDKSACGGTHVGRLAEVLPLHCLQTERLRGNTRVAFVCGDRAIRRIRSDAEILSGLTRTMAVSSDCLREKITSLESRLAEAEKHRTRLENDAAFRAGVDLYLAAPLDRDNVRREICDELVIDEKARSKARGFCSQGKAVLLVHSKETVLLAASADAQVNVGMILKDVLSKYNARGGGSPTLAQAQITDIAMVQELCRLLNLGTKGQGE